MATPQKQEIDLGITRYEYGKPGRKQVAVLELETGKYYNGGLISDATVYWHGAHSRQTSVAMCGSGGGDYQKRLRVSGREVKATQKAIDRQHAEVFTSEVVAGLVEAAELHYARVIAAGVDRYGNTYPEVSQQSGAAE